MEEQRDDLEQKVKSYLEAFDARDLNSCVDHFADDSTLLFQTTTFRGKKQIEQWHKERFHADLRLVRIDEIARRGDTVNVEGVITSKRLRAWLVNELSGAVSLRFESGRIKDVRFSWSL